MDELGDDKPTIKRNPRVEPARPRGAGASPTAEDTVVDLQLPEAVRAALRGASAPTSARSRMPAFEVNTHSVASAAASDRGEDTASQGPSVTLRGAGWQPPTRGADETPSFRPREATPLSQAQQRQTVGARSQLPAGCHGFVPRQAAVTTPPPVRKTDPSRALFRDEALRAYESDQNITSALRTESVGAWAGFLLLAVAVGLALAVAIVGHVDLTARARGALQTPEGTANVGAAVDGPLLKVLVEVGQTVRAGDILAEVDGKAAQAELLRSSRAIEAIRARAQTEAETIEPLKQEALRLLERRTAITRRRVKSQGGDESRLRRRRDAYGDLTSSGAVSRLEVDQVTDLLSGAGRTRLSLLDQLTELESQITAIKRQEADRRAAFLQELAQAEAQRAAAELLVQQVFVRAPRDGRVESLLVRQGDAVHPGTLIAQIVPIQAPRLVVVFVPERDRAFLEAGRTARIEFDRLPRGEFGTIAAKVARVAKEVAPPAEVQRYLGEDGLRGAYVRVDLMLTDAGLPESVRKHLESGAKLTARVPLRKRRFLSLVFDPVRRWLD